MKNRLLTFTVIIFSFVSYSSDAQEADSKNYLLSNISYSFFGSGDLSGSAIGITYHRMFLDKFGANISYSKATAQGGRAYFTQNDSIPNVIIDGSSPAFEIALYHSANIGLTYRTTAGERHALLAGAGLNYKSLIDNYIYNIQNSEHASTIENYYHSSKEVGFHVSLDYLFFVAKDFAIGIHGAMEISPNILSNAGISLGYRF